MTDVETILEDVRLRGDAAVREWALRLDGVEPARARPRGDLPAGALLEWAQVAVAAAVGPLFARESRAAGWLACG